MRIKTVAIAGAMALVALGIHARLTAQGPPPAGSTGTGTVTGKPITVRPAPPGGDLKTVLYNWANHMGMIRGVQEVEAVATLEYTGTGTMTVDGQPCKLTKYRAHINYQATGMRVEYACTRPDGKPHEEVQVVSGNYAWNEIGGPGAGLVPGQGSAMPMKGALAERLIRLWNGPQGAVKAAVKGGSNTKAAVQNGRNVLTYPIPGVPGAMATATLTAGTGLEPCAGNCAERIEVRQGNTVAEFVYSNYADYNEPEEKLDAFYAGHIIEKRGGATLLDLTVTGTNTGNLYIVMPVPDNVKKAGN